MQFWCKCIDPDYGETRAIQILARSARQAAITHAALNGAAGLCDPGILHVEVWSHSMTGWKYRTVEVHVDIYAMPAGPVRKSSTGPNSP